MRLGLATLVLAAILTAVVAPVARALGEPQSQGIGALSSDGWTILRPGEDTRFIFVSSSTGNDANTGFTPNQPKRTIDNARRAVRNGFPDWVLLKRGDEWHEEFRWGASGRSVEEPMVVCAYGEGDQRPRVLPALGTNGFSIGSPNLEFLAITGIEFRAPEGGSGHTGIRIIADTGEGLLIEDCLISGFKDNLSVIAKRALGGFQNVQIRRSVIVDASSPFGGHSQGLYADALDSLLVEGNVFDQNGWNDSGTCPPTIFNHNIYIQTTCGPSVVRENIIADASSHGLQARSGGVVENNLFLRNPLALFVAINPSQVRRNVILEGRDISPTIPRGFGIEVLTIPSGTVENNIIAHRRTTSAYGYAIQLSTGEWGPPDVSVRIAGNVVYNWADQAFRAYRANPAVYRQVEVVANDFQDTGGGSTLIKFAPPDVDRSRWTFEDNRYWSGGAASGWFRVASSSGDTGWWRSKADEWSAQVRRVEYADPERSVDTYWASLGQTGGYDAFMAEARALSRGRWDPRLSAAAVNDYVRMGFGVGGGIVEVGAVP